MEKNNSNEKNIKRPSEMCRLCLSTNATIPVFPEKCDFKNSKELPLVCKIMSSVNILVKKDDGLPVKICNDCNTKVESVYGFLQLCEASDSFLRQHLDFGVPMSLIARYNEIIRIIEEGAVAEDNL